MKHLLKLFSRKPRYELLASVHMKSGKTLCVRCDNIKLKFDGNALTSYEFVDAATEDVLYLRISEIEAISYKNI